MSENSQFEVHAREAQSSPRPNMACAQRETGQGPQCAATQLLHVGRTALDGFCDARSQERSVYLAKCKQNYDFSNAKCPSFLFDIFAAKVFLGRKKRVKNEKTRSAPKWPSSRAFFLLLVKYSSLSPYHKEILAMDDYQLCLGSSRMHYRIFWTQRQNH